MQIEYLNYLPDQYKASALQLYFNSLKNKLGPILGEYDRAKQVLESELIMQNCFAATCEQKLVGVLGIQTSSGGFVNPSIAQAIRVYGLFSGLLRMSGLALLHHACGSDELYVDGIAVATEMRGKGIGSRLLHMLERAAREKGIKTISLEVVDSNPRAQALYERLGFVAIRQRTVWPYNILFRLPFQMSTLMVKTMANKGLVRTGDPQAARLSAQP